MSQDVEFKLNLQDKINTDMLELIDILKARVDGIEQSLRSVIEAVTLMNRHTHTHDEDDNSRC